MKSIRELLFQNHTIRQTAIKNTFWLVFGQIASKLVKIVLVMYAARALGAEEYGVFSYALSLAALFTVFSDIGVGSILTREASKNPQTKRVYLATTFVIKITLLALSVALVVTLSPYFTKIPVPSVLMPLIAILLAFDALREFTFAITRANEKMQIEAGVNIITNIAIVALGLLILFRYASSTSLTIAYTIGSGIGLATSLFVLRGEFHGLFRFFDKNLIKKILQESWPFALLGMLGSIMINTDTVMLGWLSNAREVGLYAAAQKPVQLTYLIPNILALSIFPILSRLSHTDNEKFRSVLETSLKTTFVVAMPIVIGSILLANDLIRIVYGSEYLAAAPIFSVLIVNILLVFPGTLIGNAMFAHNQQGKIAKYTIAAIFGNAFFNYLLIPKFGGVGSAYATVIAQTIVNVFNWRAMKNVVPFSVIPSLWRATIGSVGVGITAFSLMALGVNIFAVVPAAMLVYLGMLWFFQEPILREVDLSRVFKRKQ